MSDRRYCVYVPTNYQSKAVQEALFDNGYTWSDNDNIMTNDRMYDKDTVILINDSKYLTYADIGWAQKEGDKILTTDEFFVNIQRYINRNFVIAGLEVTDITVDGFNVGCQRVKWTQVEDLLKLRPKEEK